MFIFLSKKIPIPEKSLLQCLAWNGEQGWIAVGGDPVAGATEGFVKVLKLEQGESVPGGAPGPSRLSMNQQLEGHTGSVVCVCWNEPYRKMTTSDTNGTVKVWMLYKGMWYEEMVHTRQNAVVCGMQWTSDGQKIIIAYNDGAVICGSVGGDRMWAKEIRQSLTGAQWSPDGRRVLLSTESGEIHVYDKNGAFFSKVPLFGVDDSPTAVQIVGIDWYDGGEGFADSDQKTLAVVFENGRVQLMQHEQDESPLLIDTAMTATALQWNNQGTVLAVTGQLVEGTQTLRVVKFYSQTAEYLRSLRVPGHGVSAVSWDGSGLSMALAVGSNIYFASVRPDYLWCFFEDTVAFAFTRVTRPEHCVIFWDIKTDQKHTKYVKHLQAIRAHPHASRCLLVTHTEDSPPQYILILCNTIGTPVDSKYIDFKPVCSYINATHVVACSKTQVYVWQYAAMKPGPGTDGGRVRVAMSSGAATARPADDSEPEAVDQVHSFGIDDSGGSRGSGAASVVRRRAAKEARDAICAVTASATSVIVCRESGSAHMYSLANCRMEEKFTLHTRPHLVSVNSDASRLCLIDMMGIASLYSLPSSSSTVVAAGSGQAAQVQRIEGFERKDAWALVWALDDPEMFVLMEKNRLYVFRGTQPEEPVACSGYICRFVDLRVDAVLLDVLMSDPDNPNSAAHALSFETKPLRDTRTLCEHVNVDEACEFVEDHPHPKLWSIVAEAALGNMDMATAERAFVRRQDYQGIQFVKRLQQLSDKNKQRAEIAAYFGRPDEAEAIYRKIERMDLAIDLRSRIGDWFKVVSLSRDFPTAGREVLLRRANIEIGDYYADRMRWAQAVEYYEHVGVACIEKLARAYYMMEDFEALHRLGDQLPEGHPLLKTLAERLASVGLSEQAVSLYVRAQDIKAAIDCCVELNQWERAVTLAEKHNVKHIGKLLSRYAYHLLETGNMLQAIELYREANHYVEAAKLLYDLASEDFHTNARPQRAKKLAVLAALQLEEYRGRNLAQGREGVDRTLDALLDESAGPGAGGQVSAGDPISPWRAAEAYHFYMLAQRQLYQNDIQARRGPHTWLTAQGAVRTAARLREYQDVLGIHETFALLALASYLAGRFGMCSRAFIALESLDTLSDEQRRAYETLAVEVFKRHGPKDKKSRSTFPCPSCGGPVEEWHAACPACASVLPVCVASGSTIRPDESRFFVCRTCQHKCLDSALASLNFCPMCHTHV